MNDQVIAALTQLGLNVDGRADISRCSGGDINEACRCRTADADYFIKLHQTADSDFFNIEARALRELADVGGLAVPSVIGTTEVGAYQALVLSYVPLQRLTDKGYALAGMQLARCHQAQKKQHGWYENNLIGATPQINDWQPDWPDFFINQRLKPQIERLNHSSLNALSSRLDVFHRCFERYQPEPSLLHGDLWAGNLAANEQGEPLFYDPASYYGDRETDIALTELFGGFPQTFYRSYDSVWPLDAGYISRRPWYQLYHVLNHANLFGGHYVDDAHQRLRSLVNG